MVGEAIAEHSRTGNRVPLAQPIVDELPLSPEWARKLYGHLGQDERVLEGLRAAHEARTGAYDLLSLKYSDNYSSLRDDPRYQELVRQMGPG
jgi:hypothetical protein